LEDAVKQFVARFADRITGVVSGFDRLVFRGHLLPLVRDFGMFFFLQRAGVRLLDFKNYVLTTSQRVKTAALADVRKLDRPQLYLGSSRTSKEDLARKLLAEHPVQEGLVCAFTTVEPCMSFEYHRSKDPRQRGLKLVPRKCLHLYKYFLHPRFGFINARLQTWFPFNIQICLNGREWLARDLTKKGSTFKRADNGFTWLSDPPLAQRLLDQQLQTAWPEALTRIARSMNPLHRKIFAPYPMDYYWSAYQTEWATDLLFRDPATLAKLYPALVRHAMDHFKSPDVMRFLGRKEHGNFTGELTTSFKSRPEGVRVKHWVRGNSIKMYDKAASILRIETTIARTQDFKVFRPPHNDPDGRLDWKPLRTGVADLHRRAEISQRSNERYLEALAAVEDTTPCSQIFDSVAKPVTEGQRRFRALRIGELGDLAILQAVARGEFATAGFRNRDLRLLLHPASSKAQVQECRRLSAKIGRHLRLLRAHGLIRKVQKTHRYLLTPKGHLLTAALRATRDANLKKLVAEAA
jgi:hypothetical protein